MNSLKEFCFFCLKISIFLFGLISSAVSEERGIYITQYNFENTAFLKETIRQAKASRINTFVVDAIYPSKVYADNMPLLKQAGINYVARVVVFPGGGSDEEVNSLDKRMARYRLAEWAAKMGASAIQLDYIRYNTKRGTSPVYTQNIHNIIRWFKARLASLNVPLQIDVFGETCFGPSRHIGQNLIVFSDTVDGVNPMVYPSHYKPFEEHSANPYSTVYSSLTSLRNQFNGSIPFKVTAFIETSNYHYSFSDAQLQRYIVAQIKATRDAKINGWYAWSAHNLYKNLYKVLQNENKNSLQGLGNGEITQKEQKVNQPLDPRIEPLGSSN